MSINAPAMSTSTKPLQSVCHCGAITVTLSHLPELVNECQCTICRRYAAAWGYYNSKELEFEQMGAGTKTYVWGDGDLEFHSCDRCGCIVYWWRIKPNDDGSHEVGVNTRNMNPDDMRYVERRIQYDMVVGQVRDAATKHRDDVAEYS